MNRLDRIVVFRPLGANELKKILTIELTTLQQRIFNSAQTTPFVFNVTEPAKDFLLREGTDVKYGARHLKRTIERSLVHPLSNLIASAQIQNGDLIQVDFDNELGNLTFTKEAENIPGYMMVQMTETSTPAQVAAAAMAAELEAPRIAAAKSSRRS
jgi:ATP-dependent Clp protease ATP-binding subunit ClpA